MSSWDKRGELSRNINLEQWRYNDQKKAELASSPESSGYSTEHKRQVCLLQVRETGVILRLWEVEKMSAKARKETQIREQQSHCKSQARPQRMDSKWSRPIYFHDLLHANDPCMQVEKANTNRTQGLEVTWQSPYKFKEKRNSRDQEGSIKRVHPEWKGVKDKQSPDQWGKIKKGERGKPCWKAQMHFHVMAFWMLVSWLSWLDSWPQLLAHYSIYTLPVSISALLPMETSTIYGEPRASRTPLVSWLPRVLT